MNETILIVDDSKTVRSFLKFYLVSQGYTVLEAENGEDAVGQILSDAPQLVITDLDMPVMSGFDMVKKLRANEVQVPVIVLSGNSSQEDLDLTDSLGISGFLIKPFTKEVLYQKVEAAISGANVGGREKIDQKWGSFLKPG